MTAVAGGPIQLADLTAVIAGTTGRPLVRLVQQSAQAMANNSLVTITFGAASEEIDTHGFHDTSTNNTRITPSVAGYYRLTGTLFVAASTALTFMRASIGKNGTVQTPMNALKVGAANVAASAQTSLILQANGTSDYFELICLQNSGGSLNTIVGASNASVLECEYLRPL